MPSKKALDQSLTWLRSKANERDTLDGINAELCINVIMDLKRQYERLGIQFGNLSKSKKDPKDQNDGPDQISFL